MSVTFVYRQKTHFSICVLKVGFPKCSLLTSHTKVISGNQARCGRRKPGLKRELQTVTFTGGPINYFKALFGLAEVGIVIVIQLNSIWELASLPGNQYI